MDISEHDLLEKYLDINYPDFERYTNVPIGYRDDWKHEMMYRVTRKRADAVVIKSDKVFLIEAKLKPKPEGIGQLLVYENILFGTPKFSEYEGYPIIPIYLVPRSDSDVKEVCHQLGIKFEVFTPD